MPLRAILALVLSLALLATPVAAQDERVERVTYQTSVPGPLAQPTLPNPTPIDDGESFHFGGHSLDVEGGETEVEIYLLDITHRRVPGRLTVHMGQGNPAIIQDFCFHAVQPLPPGAQSVTVTVSPLMSPCPVDGLNNGPAVRGEIVFSFR